MSLNPNTDPRVGSSRDNSTAGSIVGIIKGGSNSSSGIALLTTLLPVTIYAVVCFLIFLTLRRKFLRVYSPRALSDLLYPHERSPELPLGWFNWMRPFAKVSDSVVLKHGSLDGFLFLRFLKTLCVMCIVGCCITWPILLPIHANGGGMNQQLDKITFGNVTKSELLLVHGVMAWVYFGFILYMITRECVYYINLRQAYMLSPAYAKRLSSRTVLFCCVPQQNLDEAKLRKILGDSVRTVWLSRESYELDHLVKERDQTALRLEKAEITLIKKANAARNIAIRNGHPDIEANIEAGPVEESVIEVIEESPQDPAPTADSPPEVPAKTPVYGYGSEGPPSDINGSVAAQWLLNSQRPGHRPLANYGRRVDTIKWTRARLKQLTLKINKLRRQQRFGKGTPIPAVFVEFDSQVNAQSAFQSLAHHRALHMSPRLIGVRPHEIVWSSLRLKWFQRIIRRFAIQAFIAALVLFWSIPCAIIGLISNIDFLTKTLPFLGFINQLPTVILGLIKGLLPSVALSFLMSLVPGIMRKCARVAGVPSLSAIELFSQSAYFIFQVVQVFLVTTLTSAASAAFQSILDDPLSVRTLLAANLPKASNFYVSYFILQGLASSASRLVHFSALFKHQILKNSSDNPRFISNRWHKLKIIHWGGIYPVSTNMMVIALCYAHIAPVTLGFAGAGFYLLYLSYRYNLMYVYDAEIDTRGLLYPRALKHLLVGLYMAEVCMMGLFVLGGSFGSLLLMVLLLIFTILVHMSLNDALGPLLYNMPKTLATESEASNLPESSTPPKTTAGVLDVEKLGSDCEFDLPDPNDPTNPNETIHGESTSRAFEGGEGAAHFVTLTLSGMLLSTLKSKLPIDAMLSYIDFWTYFISPDPARKPNFVIKWLHPEIFADYTVLQQLLPEDVPEPTYADEVRQNAYHSPNMWKPLFKLWIPRDAAGISRQEVAHTGKVNPITDEGAWLDASTNRIVVDMEARSPVVLERIPY